MNEKKPNPAPDGATRWLGEDGEKKYTLLATALELREGFQLHIVGTPGPYVRDEVIRRLTAKKTSLPPLNHLEVVELDRLVEVLLTLSEPPDPVGPGMILTAAGRDDEVRAAWATMLQRFNLYRNNVVKAWKRPIILIGPSWFPVLVGDAAPDLWSVRLTSTRFLDMPKEVTGSPPSTVGFWPLAHELESEDYYLDLAKALADSPRHEDQLIRVGLLHKAAEALRNHGKWDEALEHLREALNVADHCLDEYEKAVTMGYIADILQSRGDLDEALRIRQEEELPVYERLGDVLEKAVTMGQIADILQLRGDLDEALRIREQEELPVYERLGNVRSKAVAMERIADILQSRGDLDEALRIRQEEQMPVYERLGDVFSKAVTMGYIADILQSRGDLDEALRIRQEEELPVYERLSDVRLKAVTMGKIADILQSRGDLDEALRIRHEEELPVYESLGDVRSRAVTMGKIADILQSRGDLDEALRIRQEEQLPVYERLGDVREKAACLWYIALLLSKKKEEDPFTYIEQSYRICAELQNADGLSIVGRAFGDRLCRRGEVAEGLKVLECSRASFLKLGQADEADEVSQLIAKYSTDGGGPDVST